MWRQSASDPTSTEHYSFHAHSRGVWSLEHIHAQNALDLKRDEKVWTEWLRLHRGAISDVPSIDEDLRKNLLAEIDGVLAAIADPRIVAVGTQFDQTKALVETALTEGKTDWRRRRAYDCQPCVACERR